ncbi:hypothetical protein EYR38_002051 [Pleurotus pulmonarius]|nr:hypothetical protein EYR38_002051 [Pleurotus pulmonarius]
MFLLLPQALAASPPTRDTHQDGSAQDQHGAGRATDHDRSRLQAMSDSTSVTSISQANCDDDGLRAASPDFESDETLHDAKDAGCWTLPITQLLRRIPHENEQPPLNIFRRIPSPRQPSACC